MEEVSEKQTAIQQLPVTKERVSGLMSSQDSAPVIDGLKEEIFRVIRDKIEIEMLDNARVAKTVNLELQVKQLTESLKISRIEEARMRVKILMLEQRIGLAVEKEEETARKYSALASEKKGKEKTIKVLTEERNNFCRLLENKQRELYEANRTRYWIEQVKVNHEYAIAWFQGELGRMRYVADGLNVSCKEFKDKNEQLLSQVACMAKKIEVADIELEKMRSERGKENDELNNIVVRNKRSNSPTEEEVSSLRKKGKFELSHVQGENVLESDTESSDASSDLVTIKYPAAVFHDFDKDRRREDCFAANQIWATYDSTDILPRTYALVRKVAPFKLKVTWLKPDPDDEGEMDWCDADLPIACGQFILGDSENVTSSCMFSHQIQCMKRGGEGSYLIYPKTGETWAIFRDWDIKWSSNPENHGTDEFEYVEILSDFTQDVGIEVAYLVKAEGFVSLFQKAKKNGLNMFCILPNELYRFSHQIPSYKMTGKERKGVPRGCFELDTAALLLT